MHRIKSWNEVCIVFLLKKVLRKRVFSMKKAIELIFGILIIGKLTAQDAQFSQYYAAPLYHNPAFAGAGYAPRFVMNYRNQWPSLGANFVTSNVSFDHYFDKFNSGVGITLLNDSQGSGRLKNTELALQYAYQLRINEDNFVRLGVQGGFSSRGVDVNGLTFGEQFTNQGFISGSTPNDPLANPANFTKVTVADFAAGAVYFNQKMWLGVSTHHLTQPEISPISAALGGASASLPMKYTITGGLNIPLGNPRGRAAGLSRDLVATPTFLVKKQGKFSQLDLGAYLTYSPLTLGLWYRGIPIQKYNTERLNHDALVALVGFRLDSFSIGYSYDLTISSLGVSTGGSHELSIAYQFAPPEGMRSTRGRRNKKELSCPKF